MIAVVAGGTGLVGSFLLDLLNADRAFTEVRALTRSTQPHKSAKVRWVMVDFDRMSSLNEACRGVDVAFCSLGTTIKKAGSQEAFRQIDHGYTVAFAKAAKEGGAAQFHVVSAIGASAKSGVFYSRVKGEMEEALGEMQFEGLGIYQPSFLKGPRKERRVGEQVAGAAMSLFAPVMAGALSKYKPIHVHTVAAAMAEAAKENTRGIATFQYREMVELAERNLESRKDWAQ